MLIYLVAPSSDLKTDFKAYFAAPSTTIPENWNEYKKRGATTFEEDPTVRTINAEEWEKVRVADQEMSDKIFAEKTFDLDQTSVKATEILKANPKATLEELNNKDNIINCYPGLGSTHIALDKEPGFYFAVFTGKDSPRFNSCVIVEQESITPDFHMNE